MPMNPAMRPESYSELVSRSWKLYWEVLPSTILLAFFVSVIIFIPRLICVAVGQNVFLGVARAGEVSVLYIAMYISILWFLAAVIWCINCIERNQHQNFIVDIKMAGRRILYVLGAAFCIFVIGALVGLTIYLLHRMFWLLNLYSYGGYVTLSLLTFLMFLQVSISLSIILLFYFYFPLIVIERDTILPALKQSAHLVWKKMGMTLRAQATPWLLYLTTLIIIKVVFHVDIHLYFMPVNPVANFYPTLLHIVILALFIPWGCSMMLVQLRDLELRKVIAK